MKLIIKIELVILVLVLLAGAGLILVSQGALGLFREPVAVSRQIPPLPTDAPSEPVDLPEPPVIPEKQPLTSSRELTATKYFAYDVRQGAYLAVLGDPSELLYPASITKLLTCRVVLNHMSPDDSVVVGDAMNLVQEDSSLANLKEGDRLTVENLIAAMLLPSGNDAAQVAAVAAGRVIAGDSGLPCQEAVEVFVEEMNREAQALGMENSHFVNPDGFPHDGHYTTMDDLVMLCQVSLANELILKYTSRLEETLELPDRELTWVNTNFLLDSREEDLYLPNTLGLKTGYTGKAGNCLVSAFFMGDRLLIIGVFGCPAFTMDRYWDTVQIYNSL